jgi:hypothetical protein
MPIQRVPRDWDHLPSIVVMPVNRFVFNDLLKTITEQAPDKQLVCLAGLYKQMSQKSAFSDIQLLYEFADDPLLVMIKFLAPTPGSEKLIIRSSFMKENSLNISASNLYDLAAQLLIIARKQGFHTKTVE